MNVVVLVGRLTKEAELKYTQTGIAIFTFTIAVDDPFANEKKADFINVVVWRQQAEKCAQYLKKGRLVGVEGRWSTRNYEGNDGKRVYVNECTANNVRFMERGEGNGQKNQSNDPFKEDGKPIDIDDSDLPF